MNPLKNEYDDKLFDALFYTDDYLSLKEIPGVYEKIMQPEFRAKFIQAIYDFYYKTGKSLSSEKRKNCLLSILNDMRFSCKFISDEDREETFNGVNTCISILSEVNVTDKCFIEKKLFNPLKISLSEAENYRTFCFFFIHYYLENMETFEEKAIPYFYDNMEFYIMNVQLVMDNYPELLKNKDFIDKTKLMITNFLEYISENSEFTNYQKKKLTKNLRRII